MTQQISLAGQPLLHISSIVHCVVQSADDYDDMFQLISLQCHCTSLHAPSLPDFAARISSWTLIICQRIVNVQMEDATDARPWSMALGSRDNGPEAAAGSSALERNPPQMAQMAVGEAAAAACPQQAAGPSLSPLVRSHHQAAAAASSVETDDNSDVRISGACPMAPGPQVNGPTAAADSSKCNPLQITQMAVDDAAAAACRQQAEFLPQAL